MISTYINNYRVLSEFNLIYIIKISVLFFQEKKPGSAFRDNKVKKNIRFIGK